MEVGIAIDKILAPLFPVWAFKRSVARSSMGKMTSLATYEAGKRSRQNEDWRPNNASADGAILGDFSTIIARSRQMARDNGYMRSAIKAYKRNVIGMGINPNSAAKSSTGRRRKSFNRAANNLWKQWSAGKGCDIEGRKNFTAIQLMAVQHLIEVGEFFIVFSAEERDGMVGLTLQCVESEQVDNNQLSLDGRRNNTNPNTGNEIKGGVEVDKFGKPVAYWILDRHPNEIDLFNRKMLKATRVPADRVLHLFFQERPQQTRAVSWMTAGMQKLRDLGEYDTYMLWAARMQACVGLLINKQAPSASAPVGLMASDNDDLLDTDGNREVNFHPMMTFEGRLDEQVTGFNPTVPGPNYSDFTQQQLRAVAASCGISYEALSRDYRNHNFSSHRQVNLDDRREYEAVQSYLMEAMLQPIWDKFIEQAVIENKLPAPPGFFANVPSYCACDWSPPGWNYVDPVKELSALKLALGLKVDTYQRAIRAQGRDMDEVFEDHADAEKAAASAGIELPDLSGDLGPVPTASPPSNPPAKNSNKNGTNGRMRSVL